ncbi:hypothetical protein NsoK4_08165 [Nitrosopumilus sp. K4]|uniref:hypothetical protein n=1 Tax=Nitrosopumilus sp. K4 TaxID=2795383 RepID=UPI001BAB25DF|nr:hypothetical protein [Nitrosopumilus sp. K4]QUC64390.1 hypothetical protein NsoK4_08165 [Nitrosopumilus sp. K4]
MKHKVSNLIPDSGGHNIAAQDMIGIVDVMSFINFMESAPGIVLAQVKEVSN